MDSGCSQLRVDLSTNKVKVGRDRLISNHESSSIRKNQRKRLFNFIIHLKIIQPFFPSKIAPRKLRSECQSGGNVSDLSFNCVRSQKQWD